MTTRLTWPRPSEILAIGLMVPVLIIGLPGVLAAAGAEAVIRRRLIRSESVLLLAGLAIALVASTAGGWAAVSSDYRTTVVTLLHGHLPGLAVVLEALRIVPAGVLVGAGMAEFEFINKGRGN